MIVIGVHFDKTKAEALNARERPVYGGGWSRPRKLLGFSQAQPEPIRIELLATEAEAALVEKALCGARVEVAPHAVHPAPLMSYDELVEALRLAQADVAEAKAAQKRAEAELDKVLRRARP